MSKILIVEDDKKILMTLTIRLKTEGHEVVSAQDAMMGTAVAVKEKPDLAILDISMPGGNGIQIAERMQENAATMGTPVIFITASRDPAAQDRAKELGAVGFLTKPYHAEELLSTVRRILSPVPEKAPQLDR